MKLLFLILRNLRRSWLRTTLTALGTVVLVIVVTLSWSFLAFFDSVTAEKSKNFKAIVTERWQVPSQLPYTYASTLEQGAARDPTDVRPTDSMSWQFYGGTLDPHNLTRENMLFAIAMDPSKISTMMDELEELTGEQKAELDRLVAEAKRNRQGLVIGADRLKALNKRVGERIKLYGLNFKDIDLEFEIIGVFPVARYNQSAAFNREYLEAALQDYQRKHNGQTHPLANKSMNLMWLRVPDQKSFDRVASQISTSPLLSLPAVKVESQSNAVARFMESYRDIFWGVRWVLTPAVIFTLVLVLANAISISVRERGTEMAILKVLGFRPVHILLLVLGEALAIGAIAGVVSATGAYFLINNVFGGIKMPIAFFPVFLIPTDALWWGLAVGGGTALVGSILPSLSACSVKVSDVFAKIG
jgi:putative ABC transport system permease protein